MKIISTKYVKIESKENDEDVHLPKKNTHELFDLLEAARDNDTDKFIEICEKNPKLLFPLLSEDEWENMYEKYAGTCRGRELEKKSDYEFILYELPFNVCNGINNNLELLSYIFRKNPDLVTIQRHVPERNIYRDDRTATHYAALNNYTEILEFMLKNAEKTFEGEDIWGFTPSHLAAREGAIDSIKFMKNNCPKYLLLKNSSGSTPLSYAIEEIEARKKYDLGEYIDGFDHSIVVQILEE